MALSRDAVYEDEVDLETVLSSIRRPMSKQIRSRPSCFGANVNIQLTKTLIMIHPSCPSYHWLPCVPRVTDLDDESMLLPSVDEVAR